MKGECRPHQPADAQKYGAEMAKGWKAAYKRHYDEMPFVLFFFLSMKKSRIR